MELWSRVQQRLAPRLPPGEYDTWFRPATLLDVGDREVVIGAGNIFAKEHITSHYRSMIETAFTAEIGRHLAVHVVIS